MEKPIEYLYEERIRNDYCKIKLTKPFRSKNFLLPAYDAYKKYTKPAK